MTKNGYNGFYNSMYLYLLVCFVNIGNTNGITTCHFENTYGCSDQLPAEQTFTEGWRIHTDNQNSYAFASCSSNCVQYMTLLRGFQGMQPSKWDVNLCYYVSTLDGAIDTSDVQLRVIACGKNKTVPLTGGAWHAESIRITCMEPFDVGFEIHFGSAFQRIAMDQVTVKDPFMKSPAIVCPEVAPSLFDLHPAIVETSLTTAVIADNPVAGETAIFGDELDPDEEADVGNVSSQSPKKPSASEKTTPSDGKPGQNFFNDIVKFFKDLIANPLLLAEVLAIATVAVCCMTISIHCFIWRKQRKSYRLDKARSVRAQRYLARDLSNSDMLLDMTLHDSSDSEFSPIPRSRSSSKATPPVDKAKLKATKQAADRRATVSNGSGEGSSDEAKPRPHPRTKSLPSRPANNYYETIDEVRKHALQPVQESDADDSKNLSQSLPSLEEKPPEPPKSRRSAKSCRDKRDGRSKKQKKQSKKQRKNDAKEKASKITEEQVTTNGTTTEEQVTTNDTTYENGGLKIPQDDGHLYDKLGRESHSHTELVCNVCVQNGEKRRGERLSLNVDVARDPFQKKIQFRPRAYSQEQASPDWDPPSPSLANQNIQLKGGVSRELNKKITDISEERTYFTLEPIEHPPNNPSERSSSELSDDVIIGSLDTLQEQIILSKNHTDSFKRSVNSEQKRSRPNSLALSNTAEDETPKENGIPSISIEMPVNGVSGNSKEDPFADRTYQTLEPPKMNGQLRKAKSSEETYF